MPRVEHFEIYAEDPERAQQFYSNVFGWRFQKYEGPFEYWMINTGVGGEEGIDGGLSVRSEGQAPVNNVIGVDSIDDYLKKIVENGGTVVHPKAPIPGMGWTAYFLDTEGIYMGLYQGDPTAS